MEKSLSLPKQLALFLPTTLTCHLPWWLQWFSPLSCCCLDITAQLWPLASPSVCGRLESCLQASFVGQVCYHPLECSWGDSGTHGSKGWPPPFIPYTSWHTSRYYRGEVLPAISGTRSGSCNSPALLYKSQVLHVSKTSGASKEPELN